jgi:hypothetical protein
MEQIKGHYLSNEDAKSFLLAGKCIATFLNSESGNRYTYKISKKKNSERDIYFVKVLTGGDNNSDYTFFGSIYNNQFKWSQKSSIKEDANSVKVFNYVFSKLFQNKLDNRIQIWHEGLCGRCGRKLTVPESILNGIGPECAKKLKISK